VGGGSLAADGTRLIPSRRRPGTLRGHLLLLVLAAVVPVTIFALVTVGYVLHAKRQAEERGVLDAARLVAQAVDRELISAETALRVLGTSVALRSSRGAGSSPSTFRWCGTVRCAGC
jgi:hypothetical protein